MHSLTFEDIPSLSLRSLSRRRCRRCWAGSHPGMGEVRSRRQWLCTRRSRSSSFVS